MGLHEPVCFNKTSDVQERLDATAAVVILENYFRNKDAALQIASTFGLKSSGE